METTERLAKTARIKLGKIILVEMHNSSPEALGNSETYQLQTFSKSTGGRVVAASGQIITYSAQVTMYTQID